MTILKYQ